jgi:Rieske Fe-S protein
MQRRRFLETCAAMSGAAALGPLPVAWCAAPPRLYERALLTDSRGQPLAATALAARTNYVFQYPYAGTPCFLLNLGQPVMAPAELMREDGSAYAWSGGVGPSRAIVAYSAICAHKLAYPTRELSFIRYQPQDSPLAQGHTIHCCAEHSVYDPTRGAKVVAGPAPEPLAAILLEYDARAGHLYALGTVGAEQFERFFGKYEFKLQLEYGAGKARRPVGERTIVRPLDQYCRQTIQC